MRFGTKGALAESAGTAGTGRKAGMQSESWFNPARLAGVLARVFAFFAAVGFCSQTLAQETAQTPVAMLDSFQFMTLFITILTGLGAIIVGGGAMFWILVKRIDSVKYELHTEIGNVNTKIDRVKYELHTEIGNVNTKIDHVKDELRTEIGSVKDLIEENERKNQKEHAELEKKIDKEVHQLQLNINEKVGKSEENVKKDIRQLDNTIHKLIEHLEGAQLIPNTHSSSQTGDQ